MSDFWSRRRAAVAAEAEAEVQAAVAAEHAEEQAKLDELSDEELLVKLELPNPDEMQQGDDFAAFMKQAVPERLRRRALRRLWTSNPVLANVDMLVDYGEDFTDSAMVVENLQTAYQVGKGMKAHVEELARQARALEDAAEEAPADLPEDDPDQTPEDATEDAPVLLAAAPDEANDMALAQNQNAPIPPVAQPPNETLQDEAPEPQPMRRRMRFQFET
ncbi:DUF3306 domain-containing protein [Thalassovita sp.]|uniref:DUF3306 domain-containing protein n=1 Tax=Thalassovita sp. TaxID=1979401 RepID=UPI002AB12B33|nr:DUF3306 domain-containing protein [Thalassovita sp.]